MVVVHLQVLLLNMVQVEVVQLGLELNLDVQVVQVQQVV